MCIAAPGKVIKINGREAMVEYPGVGERRAMVGVPKLNKGDWVMVQMGVVMQVVEKTEAELLEREWSRRG